MLRQDITEFVDLSTQATNVLRGGERIEQPPHPHPIAYNFPSDPTHHMGTLAVLYIKSILSLSGLSSLWVMRGYEL